MNLQQFSRNICGNVSIIFGIAAVPLFVAAGIAVDYSGQMQQQAQLQAAIDAGTLAGAKTADPSEISIKKEIRKFAKANDNGNLLRNGDAIQVDVTEAGEIRVSAEGTYSTTLLKVIGIDELPVSAHAVTKRRVSGAEIAMVLDVTGSMRGAKIDALKNAARRFISETTRPNAHRADSVKLSLVPYNKYVNVGLANRDAAWIDVPDDRTETRTVCQDWSRNTNPHNCRTESYTYYNDGVQQSGTRRVCDYDVVVVNECRQITSNYSWYGCVGSREHPWNKRDARPDYLIPALQNISCAPEITPLTSDTNTLNTGIDALTASGDTYIPAGLMWGWRTLTKGMPYTEGLSAADAQANGVSKHIVLMTDGENVTSKSTGSAYHNGGNASLGDSTTSDVCDNIKGAGITIHAIAFEVTAPSTKSLLEGCANSVDFYYDASNAVELSRAFDAIAGKINMVYLAE